MSSQPNESGSSSNVTRHCFVLCPNESPGDLSRAGTLVQKLLGRRYSTEIEDSFVTVFRDGEEFGLLAHLPAPIPNQEAEAHADANIFWPDGRHEAGQHRSHVIVTTLGSKNLRPVQSAISVTQLALLALKLFDGIGVYWGNAQVCNSRSAFEGFCEDLSEEKLPIPMWLRFQLFQSNDGFGMYTLGMQQFDLMDIEVDLSPMEFEELFEFIADIAHYLIQQGPVIADGDTVGQKENQRIVVRHQPSMLDDSRTVYKLVFN